MKRPRRPVRRLAWLLLPLALAACRHADHNAGALRAAPGAAPARLSQSDLQRPYALPDLLFPDGGDAHAQWLRRLTGLTDVGDRHEAIAFRLESHTTYDISPPAQDDLDTAPVQMGQDSQIISDGNGDLHISHSNDHGYGVDAILVNKDGDWLYLAMRYAPFVRRRPEDDEPARLLATAEDSDALLELLGPWLQVGEAQTAAGGALTLPLSLREAPLAQRSTAHHGASRRGRSADEPSRLWRRATTVEELSGSAVVDPERKILLGLELKARFSAPRPISSDGQKTAPVAVRVAHRMVLDPRSSDTKVSAPADWMETPTRPRPMLDRQELLDGLVKK